MCCNIIIVDFNTLFKYNLDFISNSIEIRSKMYLSKKLRLRRRPSTEDGNRKDGSGEHGQVAYYYYYYLLSVFR